MATLNATREYNLIYVYRIPDDAHKGLLKIGKASVSVDEDYQPEPQSEVLNDAANVRIRQETNTAGIQYELLYTELAYFKDANGRGKFFDDHSVHDVLENSGKHKHNFGNGITADEWYQVTLDIAIQAIAAVKEERQSLGTTERCNSTEEIHFREEQADAINRTIEHFKVGDQYLWNAKMRFGKTLCALQVVQQMNYKRTLILTHRPVVRNGWFEDFEKIKFENYQRATKKPSDNSEVHGGIGESLENMEKDLNNEGKGTHYIYFISMQDLRGSKESGGKFDKNNEVFKYDWDLVIIDEAHEGTTTKLGKAVISKLKKRNRKMLYLSGTPYNILNLFSGDEIYTWDYVMEQQAKAEWDTKHPGQRNEYEELPRLNMCTYSLGTAFENYAHAEDDYFNFREFFRTWTGDPEEDKEEMPADAMVGDFVHKDDVRAFLDLLTHEDPNSYYPFANETFRDYFQHSFWVLPGVKAAVALTDMLRQHPVFKDFGIVNVAGDGNPLASTNAESEALDETLDDVNKTEAVIKGALDKVKKAIAENRRTITLSCGRLTTGVTVPEWTAVFMLAGSYSTKAATYMQTIFRVQSPAKDGTIKRECYTFDFAPDRTVTVVEDYLNVSEKLELGKSGAEAQEKDKGHHSDEHARRVQTFLHFCPIISVKGSEFVPFDTTSFIKQVNHAIADQIYRKGFADKRLFMDFAKVTMDELKLLTSFESHFSNSLANKPMSNEGVVVNEQGLPGNDDDNKPQTPSDDTPKPAKNQKNKKQRNNYLESLRRYQRLMMSIAKRFPLLLFGAYDDLDTEHWSLRQFVSSLDAEDWEQFMPKGFKQSDFLKVERLFNNDYFISATQMILENARQADLLPVQERVVEMAHILQRFHYPDKETVLTPWRIVNLHMTSTIGGYSFFKDDSFSKETDTPHLVEQPEVTKDVFSKDSRLLEINSKSGVYPLWLAYTLFRFRCEEQNRTLTKEEQLAIWDKVLAEQLFVLCKTEMAQRITERVLAGYRTDVITRCKHEKDLINILKDEDKNSKFVKRLKKYSFWGITNMTNNNLFFKATVGNPPYQKTGGSGGNNDAPIYQHFCRVASQLTDNYVSLIMPARWFAAGRENLLGEFRTEMLNNKHLSHLFVFPDGNDIFANVEIKGGICYYLFDKSYRGNCDYTIVQNGKQEQAMMDLSKFDILIREPKLANIVAHVTDIANSNKSKYADSIISNDTPFGIPSNPRTSSKTPFNVYVDKTEKHDVVLYHIENQKRKVEYAAYSDITKNKNDVNKPKVFIPGTGGSGNDPYVLGRPEIAPSHSVCSQSYLYAAFDTGEEAINFNKYLHTKFLRILVSVMKITQSAPQRVYRFVPLLDFTSSSDIDWSKSVAEIDQQLYKKYGLSQEEIAYIEGKVQAME